MIQSYDGENAWVVDYKWVGIIYPQEVKSGIALITPLAYYDDSDGSWYSLRRDERSQYFPNNGKILVLAKDYHEAHINQLCLFQVQLNPRVQDDDGPWYSLYMTNGALEAAPLAQILDWTSRSESLFMLPDLLDQGLETKDCLSQSIYIRYRNQVYGPFQLEPVPDNPKKLKPSKYRQSSSTGGPQLLVNTYQFSQDQVIDLEIGIFLDKALLGPPTGKFDWSQPQVVIKQVLQASKEMTADLDGDVQLTERKIKALARLSSHSGPAILQIDESTLQRAQYILAHQVARLDNLHMLIKDLHEEHPLLLAARKQESELRRPKIEQDIKQQLQEQQDQLSEKVQRAALDLAKLQAEIKQAEEEYQRKQTALEEQECFIKKRLVELREEPQRVLADLQIAASLLPNGGGWGLLDNGQVAPIQQGGKLAEKTGARQSRFFLNATDAKTLDEDLAQLKWREAAQMEEASSQDVKACAAALLAGLVPAPSGQAALAALRSVARVLAGGRIYVVPVPLTALAPLDLFGTILMEKGRFIPAAGGLADIVLDARNHPEQMALVVLEGIDRVPALPVLIPLLRQYHEVRSKVRRAGDAVIQITPLDLFHPQALAEDTYRKLSSFVWPENILLTATCDNNISSLPLPSEWTPRLVHMELEPPKNEHPNASSQCWQVSPERWYAWEQRPPVSPAESESESLLERLNRHQRIFYRIMQALGVKGKKAEERIEQIWPQLFAEQE